MKCYMYDRLKYLFISNRITIEYLEISVSKNWITEEEKAEIISAKK